MYRTIAQLSVGAQTFARNSGSTDPLSCRILNVLHWRTAEAPISKKWYNLFVSVDSDTDQEGSAPPRNPAQTVADIASSVAAEPKFTAPVSAAAGFDEIYRAAEIQPPPHGYTIMKIAEMLQSERIRTLPAEVKKSSILLALDAAGVKIEEVIEDAVKRDRALDTFERVQEKSLDDLEARKDTGKSADPGRAGPPGPGAQRPHPGQQRRGRQREGALLRLAVKKQQEEQKIADAVSYFVTENPITTGGAATAARDPRHQLRHRLQNVS